MALDTNKLKNTEIRAEFEKMSDGQLSDFRFLSKFIYNDVGIGVNAKKCGVKDYRNMTCWGGSYCKQYPDELAKLLVFLYKRRSDIQSFCEIGTETGGTFYVIDSFLRAVNPNMGPSLTIDNRQIIREYDRYHKENPMAEFRLMNSLDFTPKQDYDLAFIDGDHRYDGVRHDYHNMLKYAKIIVLHDVKLEKLNTRNLIEVKRFWDSIERDKIELLNEDPRFPLPVGIGIIMNGE